MVDTCKPNDKFLNIEFNSVLHGAILFFILSMFFIFYVSKVISNSMEQQIKNIIIANIQETVSLLPSNQQEILQNIIDKLYLQRLISYYSQEDPTTKTYNQWLFKLIIVINTFLFILLCVIYSTAKASCGNINFSSLFLINIVIFIFIGIVEFSFFTFVVSQYAPTSPSQLMQSVINGFSSYLN